MSDSDTSNNAATESPPHTNGNSVPIGIAMKVNAPEQVQSGEWPYPLIVELSWMDPVIGNGSIITCYCEGFKGDEILFKKDGKEIPGEGQDLGAQKRYSSLVAFYPKDNFAEDGQYILRMTMIVKRQGIDLPPTVIDSKEFTVRGDIQDSDIKPSQAEVEFVRGEQTRIHGLGYWRNFEQRMQS